MPRDILAIGDSRGKITLLSLTGLFAAVSVPAHRMNVIGLTWLLPPCEMAITDFPRLLCSADGLGGIGLWIFSQPNLPSSNLPELRLFSTYELPKGAHMTAAVIVPVNISNRQDSGSQALQV
jgi:hypothetical protein